MVVPWADRLYLSPTPQITSASRLLHQVDFNTPVPAGGQATASATFGLPIDLSGNFYFVVVADTFGQVNGGVPQTAVQAVQVQLAPYADLIVSNVEAPALTIGDPARVTIRWTVQNVGSGISQTGHWIDQVISSPSANPNDPGRIILGNFEHISLLSPGQSYSQAQSILLPGGFTAHHHLFVHGCGRGSF